MAKFDIDLWARARYTIDADTKEEAIEQALENWGCLIPDIFCEELHPSCATCGNADQDTTTKVACCNCCENYEFYIPADEDVGDEYTLADLGHNWW
jgi:hypothetical protein